MGKGARYWKDEARSGALGEEAPLPKLLSILQAPGTEFSHQHRQAEIVPEIVAPLPEIVPKLCRNPDIVPKLLARNAEIPKSRKPEMPKSRNSEIPKSRNSNPPCPKLLPEIA